MLCGHRAEKIPEIPKSIRKTGGSEAFHGYKAEKWRNSK